MEIWKAVIGYEGIYEVSDEGRVKRVGRDNIGRARYQNHVLAGGLHSSGYLHYVLFKDGKGRTLLGHRLIAAAFFGPCPPQHQINHKNGRKTDNRLRNIEYTTAAANYAHALGFLGHQPVHGSRHWNSKLTEASVRQMRRMFRAGISDTDIAAEFGVARNTVNRIRHGHWWKHVA